MVKNILVIEDDHASARLLTVALKRRGYSVQTAPNGLIGYNKACADHPDVILLDLMLPGLDGFEVLNQLHNTPETANIPIIVLSAKSQVADKERAAKLGAVDYVQKPYRIQELQARLDTVAGEPTSKPLPAPGSVLFVGPRPTEVATVVLHTGKVLAQEENEVTAVDLHPYAIEHPQMLGLSPPPAPVTLEALQSRGDLLDHILQDESGLKLISNIVGSGDLGQITQEDVQKLLDLGKREQRLFLLDIPMNAPNLLVFLALKSSLIVLVTERDPTNVVATRNILTLLQRQGIPQEQMGFALISEDEMPPDFSTDISVLAVLPADLDPQHPAWRTLGQRILQRL